MFHAADRDGVRVYSSDDGRLCPDRGQAVGACRCRAAGGVTVVTGAPLDEDGLKALAGELKKACGCGGTVRDGVIEIQGEHRDRLVKLLQARGWTVKRAGG